MEFQVKHHITSAVMFECELSADVANAAQGTQLGFAVRVAVEAGANLSGANLIDADLRSANLSGADLIGADLSGANLSGADLSGAYLSSTYLIGANLSGANLSSAYLTGANLSDANLSGADLSDADLRSANLSGADLIDGGQRSDGYRFVGYVRNSLRVAAGCRDFEMAEGRDHWQRTRGGTPLGDETLAILDHIETVARIRKLVP